MIFMMRKMNGLPGNKKLWFCRLSIKVLMKIIELKHAIDYKKLRRSIVLRSHLQHVPELICTTSSGPENEVENKNLRCSDRDIYTTMAIELCQERKEESWHRLPARVILLWGLEGLDRPNRVGVKWGLKWVSFGAEMGGLEQVDLGADIGAFGC
ncbi:hypothetical protein Tco_1048620 [Tanacetum coccineum]